MATRNTELRADDRANARFTAERCELDRAVQRVGVGQRERGKVKRLGEANQLADRRNSIKKAPMGVEVEGDDGHVGSL